MYPKIPYALQIALSIELIVAMKFLNRSVKIINFAALKDRENVQSRSGCEIDDFNGSSFYPS
jgi:hypothetical protein